MTPTHYDLAASNSVVLHGFTAMLHDAFEEASRGKVNETTEFYEGEILNDR